MILRHRMVIAALTWVAIVAVGSTLVWTVVGHAGRGLGGGTDTVAAATAPSESGIGEADASSLGASPAQEPTSAAETTPPGDASPGSSADPSIGPGGGETATGDPGGDPGSTEGSSPTVDPPATSPPGSGSDDGPPPSQDPAPQSQQKTWQGPAGRLVAACSGDRISLVAAQPNNGWHVEVENDGPEELSVHFELREEEDDDRVAARSLSEETEVHARCVGGSPSFET